MATQEPTDEITFGDITKGFKNLYHACLIRLYLFFRFIFKNWIALLLLIVMGATIGYFWNTTPKQKSTLVTQINFESAHVIYNAVDQLDEKIKNKDKEFLEEYNLYGQEQPLIEKIEIAPVVNLNDIMRNFTPTVGHETLQEILINQAGEEEEELLRSELLIPFYKKHKIDIKASNEAEQSVLDEVISYLNSNELLQDSKGVYQTSLESKIHENQLNIVQIDSLLQKLGGEHKFNSGDNQVFVNADGSNIEDLHHLLQEKSRIMNDLESLQADQLINHDPVVLLNKGQLETDVDLFYNKILWLPLFLVVIFLIGSLLGSVYNKGKKLVEQKR